MSDDRSERLRRRRRKSKEKVRTGEPEETSEQSQPDEPVKQAEPAKPAKPEEQAELEERAEPDKLEENGEIEDSAELAKQAETAETAKPVETDERDTEDISVKVDHEPQYTYIPGEQKKRLNFVFSQKGSEYEYEFDEEFEKNRHFFPLIMEHGLEAVEEMDIEEMRDRVREVQQKYAGD